MHQFCASLELPKNIAVCWTIVRANLHNLQICAMFHT